MDTAEKLQLEYVRVFEAAQMLGKGVEYVYRQVTKGNLDAVHLGALMVSRESIERLKASTTQGAESDFA